MDKSRLSGLIKSLFFVIFSFSVFYSINAYADLTRAKQLIRAGNSDAALLELESEIARNPNPEAEFLRAVTLQGIGQRSQAMEAYAQMIQSYPELPEPYNNLAVMHAEDKNFEKAVQMLERAISTNQAYATAYENLGDIYSQQASDAYNEALALNPPNSKTVEIKLNLIDNILLPPGMRKPVIQAANQPSTSGSSTGRINRPATTPAASSTSTTNSTAGTTRPISRPDTQTATPASAFDSSAVSTAVNSWAQAWSRQDVNAYLSFYADNFLPVGGQSKTAWARTRADRLAKPSFISVAVTDMSISPTGNGARASFVQNYQSDNYEDRVHKTLDLVNTPQGWKIHREQSRPL